MTEMMSKKDLDIILQVNQKAIEIQTEVANQNESVIELLEENKELQNSIDEKIDKLDKDLYRIQILFIGGILGIIAQIIQMFLKK